MEPNYFEEISWVLCCIAESPPKLRIVFFLKIDFEVLETCTRTNVVEAYFVEWRIEPHREAILPFGEDLHD